jgi:hypothetical protein
MNDLERELMKTLSLTKGITLSDLRSRLHASEETIQILLNEYVKRRWIQISPQGPDIWIFLMDQNWLKDRQLFEGKELLSLKGKDMAKWEKEKNLFIKLKDLEQEMIQEKVVSKKMLRQAKSNQKNKIKVEQGKRIENKEISQTQDERDLTSMKIHPQWVEFHVEEAYMSTSEIEYIHALFSRIQVIVEGAKAKHLEREKALKHLQRERVINQKIILGQAPASLIGEISITH